MFLPFTVAAIMLSFASAVPPVLQAVAKKARTATNNIEYINFSIRTFNSYSFRGSLQLLSVGPLDDVKTRLL
jgi:hypothetical protein